MMGESSSEELSRELSNLSFVSNVSTTVSPVVESNQSDGSEYVGSTGTGEQSNVSSDNQKPNDSSRESTGVSTPGMPSDIESAKLNEDSSSTNTENVKDAQSVPAEHSSPPPKEIIVRESSETSEKQTISRDVSSISNSEISRETSNVSEVESSSQESNVISRENTGYTNSEMYDDDFERSRENTVASENGSYSSEQSYDHHVNGEEEDEMGKEDSVLIERDGKFELVDKSDLEAEELEMLGLYGSLEKSKKNNTKSRNKSVTKNPEYAHVTSSYALSETQREMKRRRISVKHMRINEEKQRNMEEEEHQRIANEKSYKKWLSQKTASTNRKAKKEIEEAASNEERRQLAEKSYNLWLKEKEQKQKEERMIEQVRLADEAEHYIVRDRVMCERSFQQWLKQKKHGENNKIKRVERPKKKPGKQKTIIKQEQKPQTVVRQNPEAIPIEQKARLITKLNKNSKVRNADILGYQHPPSIDDLIIYSK